MMDWLSLLSENPFYEFTIILLLAALLGATGQLLKQPVIVMFILLGILVGPSGMDIVRSRENISLLAEIGIAILLFIVGLKLDLRIIRSTGRIALMTGLGQVVFTSLIGYFIGMGLGFPPLHSFYISVALTFSSTIIIVKLLSDKKEIDSLHGQIAIGLLIVQDLVVILLMIVLSAMSTSDGISSLRILKTFLSGGALILITLVAMKWIIPRLSFFLARSQELLVLFAIAWAVALASAGELMEFSSEVGAFLAGISLASSNFKDVISSRLVSLRDFLLLFFFINLGSEIDLGVIGSQATPAVIFSVFVLAGNPLIVLVIMGLMGYRKRTSFLTGLTVAQISEFSLIFAALGLSVGHITEDVAGLITLVGLITIGCSTYLIIYSHKIYEWLSPALRIFQKKNPYMESLQAAASVMSCHIIIFGLGRFGGRIADLLDQHPGITWIGVDFDPAVVRAGREKGRNIIYGDLEDPELLLQVPVTHTGFIINTVPIREHAFQLVKTLKRNHYQGEVFLTAANEQDVSELNRLGNVTVILPHQLAASSFYDSFLEHMSGRQDDKKC